MRQSLWFFSLQMSSLFPRADISWSTFNEVFLWFRVSPISGVFTYVLNLRHSIGDVIFQFRRFLLHNTIVEWVQKYTGASSSCNIEVTMATTYINPTTTTNNNASSLGKAIFVFIGVTWVLLQSSDTTFSPDSMRFQAVKISSEQTSPHLISDS